MINMLSVKMGRYVLYELVRSLDTCCSSYDRNVRLVTDYMELKTNNLGIQKESIENLLPNNTDLFVYFEDELPLGMMWGHSGSCYIRGPGIPIIQEEDTVYWFWIYTVPEARGKNVFTKLSKHFFSHYSEVKKFTALVDPSNIIMKSEMNKLGFKVAKTFSYFKFGTTTILIDRNRQTNRYKISIEQGNSYNLLTI